MGGGWASDLREPEPDDPGSGWAATTLRGACLTLVRSAPGTISRISVSGPCPTGPEAERWLRALAARLADEYGLQSQVETRAPGLSIVFARRTAGA